MDAKIKEEVCATANIELERLFTVLSDRYDKGRFEEHAKIVSLIEVRLYSALETFKETNFRG